MTTMSRPRKPPQDGRPGRLRGWYIERAPRLIAAIATTLGVLSLIDAFWGRGRRLLHAVSSVVPTPASATATAVVAVSGVLLLRIAAGLRKRKRAEWRLAVAICLALTVAHVVRDLRSPFEALVTLLLLVALLAARSRFTARADPRSRWVAARVGLQLLVSGLGYGLLLLLVPHQVSPSVSFGAKLVEVLASLVGLGGTITIRGDEYADVFHASMLAFGLLAAVSTVVLLLRPVQPVPSMSPEDKARLRALLRHDGARDSLGYFALRDDKCVVWSASGKAAITYRVLYGVALTSGDPIGDPEAWPGAIDAFRRLVEEFGWTPAVMGCSETGATVFHREYDLSALVLGDEAILSAAEFSLQGRAMRGVRQACTRVERAGYTVAVRRVGDLCAQEWDEVRRAATAWRADAVERGFSMALSRLGDPRDPDCVIATANQDGTLRGLLHFVPWGPDGLSLDLMRRDRAADNGLNEFMIASLMARCGELGVSRVSLNFAVFRDAIERGGRIGAGPVLRGWRRILLVASRWWQIESLYRFNAKFQPTWVPRLVCYPSARDLLRVTLAALEAEAFLVRPHLINRVLGRV